MALQRGDLATQVKLAAMVIYELHMYNVIANLAAQVGRGRRATNAAQQAQAAAGNAHAVAQIAGNADRLRPALPLKYGNKKKDPDTRQWLSIIEEYLCRVFYANNISIWPPCIWRVGRGLCGHCPMRRIRRLMPMLSTPTLVGSFGRRSSAELWSLGFRQETLRYLERFETYSWYGCL
jgi:hypothetical protein